MSGIRWTDEQREAFTVRGTDALVSAAAGAGKTAVLVERVIRMITDRDSPVDVDRLLVVTFTDAAAGEMKSRIGRAIASMAPQSPELRRQFRLLDRASISTLHSFCLSVVRRHFHQVGLDPSFRVMDQEEADLLRIETLDEIMEDWYSRGDQGFIDLVDAYGDDRGDARVHDLILRLHSYVRSQPWPEIWLREAADMHGLDGTAWDDLPWTRRVLSAVRRDVERSAGDLRRALDLCGRPGGPAEYVEHLEEECRRLDEVLRGQDWSWAGAAAAIMDLERAGRFPRSTDADEGLKAAVKALRGDAWRTIQSQKETLFCRPAQEHLDDLRRVRPLMETLSRLVGEFDGAYDGAKRSGARVDFADLEHLCLELLAESAGDDPRPSAVALSLRERYQEVLVDEYQDINGVQDAILRLVARPGENLFMVGDVKQSIYRFRLADPGLFLERYRTYAEAGSPGRRILLRSNFRSRGDIIHAVNTVFGGVMTRGVGELDYDQEAALVEGARFPEHPRAPASSPVEVHIAERDPGEQDDDGETLDALEREALFTARRIKRMVEGTPDEPGPEFHVLDGGEYRPVSHRDIVVLMRATRARAAGFSAVLEAEGIPVHSDAGTGYFASTEIEVALSLLRVIDNPRQDIPLAAVLRSPVVGLDPEALALIRARAGDEAFHAAVLDGPWDEDKEEWAATLSRFLIDLDGWRTHVRRRPLSEVLWRLLHETGYLQYVGGMPGGRQRTANLLALHDRSRQFDRFQRQGLPRFLRFVDLIRDGDRDLGPAPLAGETSDAVRIMSVHRSKGLEFPVVFIADLGRRFNTAGLRGPVLWHHRLKYGPRLVDPDARTVHPTVAHRAVVEELRMEELAEEMRILYVAMTRARERLVLVGSVRGLESRAGTWCRAGDANRIPDSYLSGASTYLDWVMAALARHPDGGIIRDVGGHDHETPAPDPSRWMVDLEGHGRSGVPPAERPVRRGALDMGRLDPAPVPPREPERGLVEAALDWTYSRESLTVIPARASVGDLRGLWAPGEEEAVTARVYASRSQAAGTEPPAITGRERGLATHILLQHLDLTASTSTGSIEEQVRLLVERELLDRRLAPAIDTGSLSEFFESELGVWLCRHASGTRREVPFTLGLRADEVHTDLDLDACDDDVVLVQGIIDWLVEPPAGPVVVDFKTDRLRVEDEPEIVDRYRGQVSLYVRAAETIYGMPVRRAYLVFLHTGRVVTVATPSG